MTTAVGYPKSVKLATEDNPQPEDDFLALLCQLWRKDISVNANPVRGQLTLIGSKEPEIIEWVAKHYSRMEHWLPGRCDGCTEYVIERTESFWGAHPHFCFRCLAYTVDYFERNQRWPEGNWFPGETFNMGSIDFPFGEDE